MPARRRLAHDDVDQALRHDDDLDDVLAVDVGLDLWHGEAQRLELLARSARRGLHAVAALAVRTAGRRLHAIADLAFDLPHELVGITLQPALVGGRPRLVPHAATGQQ